MTSSAVSYTHLDVYKRQNFPYDDLKPEQELYGIISGIGSDAHFGGDYRIGLSLGSVSYTHLSEFCGVDSSNQVPNGDTIGRFRNLLVKNGLQEKLFAQVVTALTLSLIHI